MVAGFRVKAQGAGGMSAPFYECAGSQFEDARVVSLLAPLEKQAQKFRQRRQRRPALVRMPLARPSMFSVPVPRCDRRMAASVSVRAHGKWMCAGGRRRNTRGRSGRATRERRDVRGSGRRTHHAHARVVSLCTTPILCSRSDNPRTTPPPLPRILREMRLTMALTRSGPLSCRGGDEPRGPDDENMLRVQ